MKIALFYNLGYGGAKRSVQEQVKSLKKFGHQVDVYTTYLIDDEFNPAHFSDNEYKYVFNPFSLNFPIIGRLISDLSIFINLKNTHKKIANDIDRKDYDVVLAHIDHYTQSPFVLRFLKTKSAYYCMEPLRIVYEYSLRIPDDLNILNKIYEFFNRSIRKKIDIVNSRSATQILSISNFCKAYCAQVYDKYPSVVYLGVDERKFKPLNAKKKNQILYFASKDYIFGFDLIEKALKKIPQSKRPTLKIVDGVNKKERISDLEVINLYNESIITLSLSRLDTFGLVPIESMACGTPVIATDMPGYREIIENTNAGFLIEFNENELAEMIMYLIDNPIIARKMGENGRKQVLKKWTWDRNNKVLEKKLIELNRKK